MGQRYCHGDNCLEAIFLKVELKLPILADRDPEVFVRVGHPVQFTSHPSRLNIWKEEGYWYKTGFLLPVSLDKKCGTLLGDFV